MDETNAPRMATWVKTVFFIGDILLLLVALLIVTEVPRPISLPYACLLVAAVAIGGILSTIPFLVEFKAMVQLAEVEGLKSSTAQLQDLERLTHQIRLATGQWQTVQEHCSKAVSSAQEIGSRMIQEGKDFAQFMEKANDSERTHLRLEIDKLRRAESEWLEVVVRICDHVYALHRAALNSGQPGLAEQLTRFQHAVRDSARRIGLVPHEAKENDLFDEQAHQLFDSNHPASPGALIAETVATGYTLQGQPIRRIVVALKETGPGHAGTSPLGQLSLVPDESMEPIDPIS